MRKILFMKSFVAGYAKQDGSFVKPHFDKRSKAAQTSLMAHAEKSEAPDAHWHPRVDEKGAPVRVRYPHEASPAAGVGYADSIATFVPDGPVPRMLNGVPFAPWDDAPSTTAGWAVVDGQIELDEPPLTLPPMKTAASGVVVLEQDGRAWLMSPTNRFGGYHQTFPKGQAEQGLSLQANAIKEAYEETGLQVRIVGFLGDFEKTTSVARYYIARRVGGTPAAMGWESQALRLVPRNKLYKLLNMPADHAVAKAIGAGEPPAAVSANDYL